MKKLVLGLFLFCSSSLVMAQGRGEGGQRPPMDPAKRAEMQTKRLTEQLGLTEEQQKKVYTLNLERGKSFETSKDQNQENRRAAMEKYNDDLNSILTPDQQTKYKEQRSKMGERGPRPEGDRPRPEGNSERSSKKSKKDSKKEK